MQADILRLILFIAGLALVLGIYLWDRRKRLKLHLRRLREREEQRERPLGVTAGQSTGWSEDPDTLDIEHELKELDELLHEDRDTRTSRRGWAHQPVRPAPQGRPVWLPGQLTPAPAATCGAGAAEQDRTNQSGGSGGLFRG